MIVDALMPRAATPAPDDDYWYTDYPSLGGDVEVSPTTALRVTTVLACVRVRAQSLAQLPVHLMGIQGQRRWKAIEHPLYSVLHDEPNTWQTSQEFKEMMEGHIVLRGNAYALIRPGDRGAVDQLIPLHPDRMQVFRLDAGEIDGGRIGYLYRDLQGTPYRLTQDEVFHLRSMSLNDCVGLSAIAEGRNTIELAQRGVQHSTRFYRNAARPSGVISLPESFRFQDEDHIKRMKKSWRDAHTGEDLFTVALLEGGAKWQQMGLSNEDAQHLETMRYNGTQICQLLDVPPHMVGLAIEHGHTYANVEQTDLAFLKHKMVPRTTSWEQAIRRDLIVQPEDSSGIRFYAKFGLDALLRADSLTRARFFEIMLRMRVYTRNEVRALEDLDPVEGGDEIDEPTAVAPTPPPAEGKQEGSEAATPLMYETAASVSAPGVSYPMILSESMQTLGDDGAASVTVNPPVVFSESIRPLSKSVNPRDKVFRAWVDDIAERIASYDIGRLGDRLDKGINDVGKFKTWVEWHWRGKGPEYVARTVSPLLALRRSRIDASGMARDICEEAISEILGNDPVEILKRWRANRAEVLGKLLWEDLSHDG
jgi:HK97 family phage portal protein